MYKRQQQGDEALSRYGSDLAALGDMLAASPKLDAALKSPVISIDEKKAVMGKLLKKIKADKTVSNFCLLLADKERLAYLGEIVGLSLIHIFLKKVPLPPAHPSLPSLQRNLA